MTDAGPRCTPLATSVDPPLRRGTSPRTGWSAGEPMACRYWGASCDSELHWVLPGAADSETACMTEHVRVLDGRVPPGAIVPVHTHRWGGVL